MRFLNLCPRRRPHEPYPARLCPKLRARASTNQSPRSLNDPDTNASCYKGLSGQRGGPSAAQRASESRPGPELRLTSRARPAFGEELEAQDSRSSEAEAEANDLFKFREKEALVRKRSEVERGRRSTAGATSSTAVRVDLATQLGLPSTATFDEVRDSLCVLRRVVTKTLGGYSTSNK